MDSDALFGLLILAASVLFRFLRKRHKEKKKSPPLAPLREPLPSRPLLVDRITPAAKAPRVPALKPAPAQAPQKRQSRRLRQMIISEVILNRPYGP